MDQNSDPFVLGRDLDTSGHYSDFESGHGDVIYVSEAPLSIYESGRGKIDC